MSAGTVAFPDDGAVYLEPDEPTPAEWEAAADRAEGAETRWRWGR